MVVSRDFLRLVLLLVGQEEAVKRSLFGGDLLAKFSSVKLMAPLEMPCTSKVAVLVKAWSFRRPKMEYEFGTDECSGIERMEKVKDPSALLEGKRKELLPSSLNPGRYGSQMADGGLAKTLLKMPDTKVVKLGRIESGSKLVDRAPHVAISRAVCVVSASSSMIFS